MPWWAHARRRARVRVERKLEAWPEIAQAVGLAGSQVMSAVVDVWGWRARFRLARGQTITDVIAKIPALESGLGTFRGAVRVYPTPDDLANRCELRVLDMDPHADAIPWPGPSVTSITQPIDFGPFEDATPCRVLFLRRHGLAGGATGGGKSGWLNVLMGNLAACRDVVIWAIDMKKGMELGPWASCIDRLATTPEEARALLADAVAILEARAALLAARGQRVWEPSPDMPALIILIDEYAELVDDAPERGQGRGLDRPARARRRGQPDRRDPAADPEGHGPGRGALADGRADLLPRPRTQGRRPHPRPGHARRRLERHTPSTRRASSSSRPPSTTRRAGPAPTCSPMRPSPTPRARYADFRPALDDVSRRALDRSGRDTPRRGTPGRFPGPGWRRRADPEADPEALLWDAFYASPRTRDLRSRT